MGLTITTMFQDGHTAKCAEPCEYCGSTWLQFTVTPTAERWKRKTVYELNAYCENDHIRLIIPRMVLDRRPRGSYRKAGMQGR